MRRYHAHIYFETHQQDQLARITECALQAPLRVWKFFPGKVGPHPHPMLELHFKEGDYQAAVDWLTQNRNGLSVLIHEDTGDDIADHAQAIWLGTPQTLRFEFFEEVKRNPALAVHVL